MEFYAFRPYDNDWQERVGDKVPATVHAAEDAAQVIVRDGRAFVQDSTLRKLGYEGILLRAGDIVKLNGKYYELEGKDKKLDVWWITHFDVEAYLRRNIHPLRVTRGPSSDDIIALDGDPTVYFNRRTGEMTAGSGEKEAPES